MAAPGANLLSIHFLASEKMSRIRSLYAILGRKISTEAWNPWFKVPETSSVLEIRWWILQP
jgi:hypothetical protein